MPNEVVPAEPQKKWHDISDVMTHLHVSRAKRHKIYDEMNEEPFFEERADDENYIIENFKTGNVIWSGRSMIQNLVLHFKNNNIMFGSFFCHPLHHQNKKDRRKIIVIGAMLGMFLVVLFTYIRASVFDCSASVPALTKTDIGYDANDHGDDILYWAIVYGKMYEEKQQEAYEAFTTCLFASADRSVIQGWAFFIGFIIYVIMRVLQLTGFKSVQNTENEERMEKIGDRILNGAAVLSFLMAIAALVIAAVESYSFARVFLISLYCAIYCALCTFVSNILEFIVRAARQKKKFKLGGEILPVGDYELYKSSRRKAIRRELKRDKIAKLLVDDFCDKRAYWTQSFWADLWVYYKDSHPVVGVFFAHRLHPYSRDERRVVYIMGVLLAISTSIGGGMIKVVLACPSRYALYSDNVAPFIASFSSKDLTFAELGDFNACYSTGPAADLIWSILYSILMIVWMRIMKELAICKCFQNTKSEIIAEHAGHFALAFGMALTFALFAVSLAYSTTTNFIAIFLSFFITHALSMMFQFVMGLGWYWRKRRKNKRNQEFKVVDVKLEKKAGADGRQTYVIKRLKTNKPKASKAAVADKSGAKGEKSQAKGRKAGEGKPQAWLAEAGV